MLQGTSCSFRWFEGLKNNQNIKGFNKIMYTRIHASYLKPSNIHIQRYYILKSFKCVNQVVTILIKFLKFFAATTAWKEFVINSYEKQNQG